MNIGSGGANPNYYWYGYANAGARLAEHGPGRDWTIFAKQSEGEVSKWQL